MVIALSIPTHSSSLGGGQTLLALGFALPFSCMGRILGSHPSALALLGPGRDPRRLSPPHGGPREDPTRGRSPLTPAFLPAGERDHAEGPSLCPSRGHQRPDHGGEAVHRLRRLLYRPLGPLRGLSHQAARSAWGAQPPAGRPSGARWGWEGKQPICELICLLSLNPIRIYILIFHIFWVYFKFMYFEKYLSHSHNCFVII